MKKRFKIFFPLFLLLFTTIFLVVSFFCFNFYDKSITKNYSIDMNIDTVIDKYNKEKYSYNFNKFLQNNKNEVNIQKEKINSVIFKLEKKYNIKATNKNYLLSASFSCSLSDLQYQLLNNDKDVKRVYKQDSVSLIKQSEIKKQSETNEEILDNIDKDTGIFKTNEENSGQNTIISIIDTGFDINHPNFSGKIEKPIIENNDYFLNKSGNLKNKEQKYYFSKKIPYRWDYIESNNKVENITKENKHGTHVAAIAAGLGEDFKGSAYNAQLALFKIADRTGKNIGVIKGENKVDEVLRNALNDAVVIGSSVINISLGVIGSLQASESYNDIFKRAEDAGIVIVCAAGNSGGIRYTGKNIQNKNEEIIYNYSSKDYLDENTIASPASSKYVLAVGSIHKDKNSMSITSSTGFLQNFDIKPDFVAPGVNILSAQANTSTNIRMSGTSMSSPNLAGQIASYISYMKKNEEKFPKFENNREKVKFIRNILLSNSDSLISKYNNKDINYISPKYQGNGLINIDKAMNSSIYFTVDNEEINSLPKIKLKQNEYNINKFNFTFTIHNISKENYKDFNLSLVLSVPSYSSDGRLTGYDKKLLDIEYKFFDGLEEKSEISVENNKNDDNHFNKIITGFIDLNQKTTQEILNAYKNGTYINGYIELKDKNKEEDKYSIPVVGYYNNNSDLKVFERNLMYLKKSKNINQQNIFDPKNMRETKYNFTSIYTKSSKEDLGSFRYSYSNDIELLEKKIKKLSEDQYNYVYDSRAHSIINKGVKINQISYPLFRNIKSIESLDIIYNSGGKKEYETKIGGNFNIPIKYALDRFVINNNFNNLVKNKDINYNLGQFDSINNSYFDFYFNFTLDDSIINNSSHKAEKLRRLIIDNQKPVALNARIDGDEFNLVYDENNKLFKIDFDYINEINEQKNYTFFVNKQNKISEIEKIKFKLPKHRRINSFTLYDYAGNFQKFIFNFEENKIDFNEELISKYYLNNFEILKISEADESNYINRDNFKLNPIYYKNIDLNLYNNIINDNIREFEYDGIKYAKTLHENTLKAINLEDKNKEELIFLEGTKIIGKNFISSNNKIKKIIMPSTLKYIENEAFKNVKNLEEIYFKSEVAPIFIGDSFSLDKRIKMLIPKESFGYKSLNYRKFFDSFEYIDTNIFLSNQKEFIPNFIKDIDNLSIKDYLEKFNELNYDENLQVYGTNGTKKINEIKFSDNKIYEINFNSRKIDNELLKNTLSTGDLVYFYEEKKYILNNENKFGFLNLSSTYSQLKQDKSSVLVAYIYTTDEQNTKYNKKIIDINNIKKELEQIETEYKSKGIFIEFYKDKNFKNYFDQNNFDLTPENEIEKIYMKRRIRYFNVKIFNKNINKYEKTLIDEKIENSINFSTFKKLFNGYIVSNIEFNHKEFLNINELFNYILEKKVDKNEEIEEINLKMDVKYKNFVLRYKFNGKIQEISFNKNSKNIVPNSKRKFLYWLIDNKKIDNIVEYAINNDISEIINAEAIFEGSPSLDEIETERKEKDIKKVTITVIVLSIVSMIFLFIISVIISIKKTKKKQNHQG